MLSTKRARDLRIILCFAKDFRVKFRFRNDDDLKTFPGGSTNYRRVSLDMLSSAVFVGFVVSQSLVKLV